jgi:hypothetical protein
MVTVESCFIVLILIFQNTTLFCNQESQYVSVDCFATKRNKIENLDGQMKEYTHKGRVGLQQRRGSIGGEVPAKFKREFALVIHRTKEKSCNRYEQLVTSVSIVFFLFSIFSSLYIIFSFSFINIRPIGEFSCFITKIRAGGACATKTSLSLRNQLPGLNEGTHSGSSSWLKLSTSRKMTTSQRSAGAGWRRPACRHGEQLRYYWSAAGVVVLFNPLKYSNRAARTHMVAHHANCCCVARRGQGERDTRDELSLRPYGAVQIPRD